MRTLASIAEAIGGELIGDPDFVVSGVAPVTTARVGQLSFILEPAFLAEVPRTQASALITFKKLDFPKQIVVKDPRKSLANAIQLFVVPEDVDWTISDKAAIHAEATLASPVSVGPFAVIGKGTTVASGVRISANVTIGKNCKIGKDCVINPGVVLYDNVELGDRVILHAGCVLGADGFGYYQSQGTFKKIPHIGKVVLGNDVEIGANTTLDRGCLGDTTIGEGTKIDNLNHLAHNTVFGKHCVVAGLVGFSGSVTIGDHVMIGGQVGFANHISVGSESIVMARSGVTKSIPNKSVVSGFPAQSHRDEHRYQARLRRLAAKSNTGD